MRSTFFGLETARRGMMTQQSALHTTGHNISNANTPGYTRQRVNFTQTEPYPPASKNRPHIPGQMGTGVDAGSIQRVRDAYIDVQYRNENNKFGYWNTKAEALQRMEEILNEPSEDGLAKTMDRFWQSLQDLADDPTDSGARSVVRQRGIAVADTFNYLHNSLTAIQGDLKNEIDVTVKALNSLARQLNHINEQIAEVEPHGYLPNDLYDERDRLLDQMSELANIKVTYSSSGGNSLDIAEGKATVAFVAQDGTEYTIVDGKNLQYKKVAVTYDEAYVSELTIGGSKVTFENMTKVPIGKLSALIEMNGFKSNGTAYGVYPEMIANLDKMAFEFANAFNEVHREGYSLLEIDRDATYNLRFFQGVDHVEGAAGLIAVESLILDDELGLDRIAAALDPVKGDGRNALELANVKNKILEGDYINGTTLQSFYEGIIGDMAVQTQEANRMTDNSNTLKTAVEQRRESVSGVSLDEEMINMVKFQQAYNASARMVTVVDEVLDRIINGMGRVGR